MNFVLNTQAAFREPRLLIVTDPTADRQPITEAAYVNLPCIALCNTDTKLSYIDIAIPCNNRVCTVYRDGNNWYRIAIYDAKLAHLRCKCPEQVHQTIA